MTRTNLSMSISADGYVAGPNQSEEHPLGVGGMALHGWHIGPAKDHPINQQVVAEMLDDMGATIMGRNMLRRLPVAGPSPSREELHAAGRRSRLDSSTRSTSK